MATSRRFDDLPMFADDVDISRAILGPGHTDEWKAISVILERHGLPIKDLVFGARYWPAVKAWFDRRASLHNHFIPSKVGGMERPREPLEPPRKPVAKK
ncbi:hypothetical protein [Xanthobacter sp. 91]|uniref:hypothetical protein n=1 Tax=Xanthobacter sp. 91 TaxID=1117244 RepID=UPI00069091AC|nr:hypothetical protein [Xanthobacter sp. 91]